MSHPQDLPVIRIDIGIPIYRMANYRTQSRQRNRLQQNGLPADWFQRGQENERQQAVQHELLAGLARTGSGETIIPITEALTRDRTQKEPLLITFDGVVVNGNRRLAAMRELFDEDPVSFASFAQIEALVLPADTDPAEIKRIEVRLQMTPQTLLPYDWIDQAVAVRDMLEGGFTRREVAELMQLTEPAVRAILGRLDEADLYLAECAGRPGEYLSISNAEQHFKEMEKALRDRRGTAKSLSRKIGQAVLQNAGSFQARIYDYRVLYGQDFERAVPLLAGQLNVEERPLDAEQEDFDDPFGGAPDEMAGWVSLEAVLGDGQRQAEVAGAIRTAAETIIDSNRGASVLEALRRIRAQLAGLNLSQAAPETLQEIMELLAEVERTSHVLREDAQGRVDATREAAE